MFQTFDLKKYYPECFLVKSSKNFYFKWLMNVSNVSKVEENTENRVSINNLVKKSPFVNFSEKNCGAQKIGFLFTVSN